MAQQRLAKILRASYDAAQTTPDNRRYWVQADGLSANAANSPEVRRTLRNRSRYEFLNNPVLKGIVRTLADYVIGTGPRLQVQTNDAAVNSRIEKAWHAWATETGFAEHLRTIHQAKIVDGEAFAVFVHNPGLWSPVKLDLRTIEADQVASPTLATKPVGFDGLLLDGLVLDDAGRVIGYQVLTRHPGDDGAIFAEAEPVGRDAMLHLFRRDRPGQLRGIPEITSALPLFAMLREFSIATLDAAKTAAYFTVLLHTNAPPDGAPILDPLSEFELHRNMGMALPEGWQGLQMKPEHPNSTYAEYERCLLRQIARCLCIPACLALGDSSSYNYASGRLDHQSFGRDVRVETDGYERHACDRVFYAWADEAMFVQPDLFDGLETTITDLPHTWMWDGGEHVDPTKNAVAQDLELKSGTTTLAEECAKKGKDWEVVTRQRAKEIALRRKLGLDDSDLRPDAMAAAVAAAVNED